MTHVARAPVPPARGMMRPKQNADGLHRGVVADHVGRDAVLLHDEREEGEHEASAKPKTVIAEMAAMRLMKRRASNTGLRPNKRAVRTARPASKMT